MSTEFPFGNRREWRRWRQLASVVLGLALAATLQAATSVSVLETYPDGDEVTLGRNQNFYLRLHYESDEAVGIWARPYFHGQPANAGSNGSYSYSGSGEALGWFFFSGNRGEVDEIRISVGNGSTSGTPVLLRYPVHVRPSEQAADSSDEPEWVARLKAADAARQRLAAQEYANRPTSPFSSVLVSLFMIAVLALGVGGFVLPVRALRRWRGGWRLAAAVPAALMGFVVLRILVGVSIDPTSHNLWPFEILMAGLLSTVGMGLMSLARRAAGAAVP
ncbi:MAG TPA: hypothetical protein VMG33_06220 [Steroidobacteraceae bacterium]|nr:hypothetical protein [Steroidobacteraceae bacterium]